MATVTVTTTSYVEVSDDLEDPASTAEEIVKDALSTQPSVYLATVTRESVLVSK